MTRDPAFFAAYYQLTFVHGRLYSLGFDHTASRLASAEAALQAAIRLRPDAGETHLARANISIMAPAITLAPWLNWKMRGEVYLMIRASPN